MCLAVCVRSGAAIIPTHPRVLPAIARRPDTARKDARELRKEKKAEEKAKKEEERRRIKGEKRREMEKKLMLLGLGKDGKGSSRFISPLPLVHRAGEFVRADSDSSVCAFGVSELTMDDLDLDDDFDEAAHDAKIAALFESGNDWAEGEVRPLLSYSFPLSPFLTPVPTRLRFLSHLQDGEKPTWNDEFGGDEGYDYGMDEGEGGEGMEDAPWAEGDMDMEEDEDAPINMVSVSAYLLHSSSHIADLLPFRLFSPQDADFLDADPSLLSSKKKKKEKKSKKDKKRAHDEIEEPTPAAEDVGEEMKPFEGTEEEKKKKAQEIMDEYYALDHEDMVSALLSLLFLCPVFYSLFPADLFVLAHSPPPPRSAPSQPASTTPPQPHKPTASPQPRSSSRQTQN